MLGNFDSNDDDWAPYIDEDEDVEQEEGQNRTFIIGAIILGAVFVIGICVVLVVIFNRNGGLGGGQQADLSPNELTNQVQMTFAAETQTAVFEAQQGAGEEEPVATEEAGAIEAPAEEESGDSPESTPTQIPTAASTEIAEITVDATVVASGEEAEEGEATNTPESSIIEVTPLPVTPADSAIEEEEEEEGSGGGNTDVGGSGAAITPTGSGGPVIEQSGSETLPETGFGGGASLAGVGLMAVALVAVVVVVRRIRLK